VRRLVVCSSPVGVCRTDFGREATPFALDVESQPLTAGRQDGNCALSGPSSAVRGRTTRVDSWTHSQFSRWKWTTRMSVTSVIPSITAG
jgi:hypothetical protein